MDSSPNKFGPPRQDLLVNVIEHMLDAPVPVPAWEEDVTVQDCTHTEMGESPSDPEYILGTSLISVYHENSSDLVTSPFHQVNMESVQQPLASSELLADEECQPITLETDPLSVVSESTNSTCTGQVVTGEVVIVEPVSGNQNEPDTSMDTEDVLHSGDHSNTLQAQESANVRRSSTSSSSTAGNSGSSGSSCQASTALKLALEHELKPECIELVSVLADRVPRGRLTLDVLECITEYIREKQPISLSVGTETDDGDCLELEDVQVAASLDQMEKSTDLDQDTTQKGDQEQKEVKHSEPSTSRESDPELSPRSELSDRVEKKLTLDSTISAEDQAAAGSSRDPPPTGPPVPGATWEMRTIYEKDQSPRVEYYWKVPQVKTRPVSGNVQANSTKRLATTTTASHSHQRDHSNSYRSREFRRSSGNRQTAEERGRSVARREREQENRRRERQERERREQERRQRDARDRVAQERRQREQRERAQLPPAQLPVNPRSTGPSGSRCYYCRGQHPAMTCHLGFRLRMLGRDGMRRFEEENPPRAVNGVIRCQLCRASEHRTWQCQRPILPPEERDRQPPAP